MDQASYPPDRSRADARGSLRLFIALLRPKQWTKNLLLFAAPLFSIRQVSGEELLYSLLGFLLFCFVSGAVYVLNDYMDREADRLHETKRHRPLASGRLDPNAALAGGALLLIGSLAAAIWAKPLFALILFVYFALNIGYSLYLKHLVILDIMIIAAGFVLRALAGGVMIGVSFTPWFLLCTMLLSLFLAIGKRRHELSMPVKEGEAHRKVLGSYSIALLDQLNGIVTTSAIICYSLFTFTSGRTIHLMWTIPLVLYGIFRYLYLIHIEGKGGAPDRILLEDKPIMAVVILYGVSVAAILLIFE